MPKGDDNILVSKPAKFAYSVYMQQRSRLLVIDDMSIEVRQRRKSIKFWKRNAELLLQLFPPELVVNYNH